MTTDNIQITLAWQANGVGEEIAFSLASGATIADALIAAEAEELPALHAILAGHTGVGVWGKSRAPTHVLRDHDRVELYRALQADPKEARRQRVPPRRRKF